MRFACTFPTSQLPKVLRERQVFTLLTSKCASRHNGVDFFDVSTSKSAPRPLVFNTFDLKMCFVPQWRARAYFSTLQSPKTLKKQMFRNFSTFPRTCIFFLLTLSLLCMICLLLLWLLPPLLFHLSILSEVWLLKFLRLYNWILNEIWKKYIYVYIYIYLYIWSRPAAGNLLPPLVSRLIPPHAGDLTI